MLFQIYAGGKQIPLKNRLEIFSLLGALSKESKKIRFVCSRSLYKCLHFCFGVGPETRILAKLLRRLNIRLVIYLGDIVIMEKTFKDILMSRDTLGFLLQPLVL